MRSGVGPEAGVAGARWESGWLGLAGRGSKTISGLRVVVFIIEN
jgi:hypothetical protein